MSSVSPARTRLLCQTTKTCRPSVSVVLMKDKTRVSEDAARFHRLQTLIGDSVVVLGYPGVGQVAAARVLQEHME